MSMVTHREFAGYLKPLLESLEEKKKDRHMFIGLYFQPDGTKEGADIMCISNIFELKDLHRILSDFLGNSELVGHSPEPNPKDA